MTPPVSVLMAVRNGGSFLDASIASMANQSFTDWEMVVVDDASGDGTLEKLGQWAKRDSRIRVLANSSNTGQTASLNRGLRECRGAWVARQDADDLSAPTRLAEQLNFLERHRETRLLGTQGILVDDRGRKAGLLDVPCDAAGIAWTSMFLNPFLHTSVVFDREFVLRKFGGYDESFRIAQDYDLWARVLDEAPAANLPGRLVSYRRTDESLSRAGRDRALDEADRVAGRQASILLGRTLSPEESSVAALFRRGLPSTRRVDFDRVRRRLAQEFGARHPAWSGGPRSVQSSWHLRLAGSAGTKSAVAAEVLSALAIDPCGTLRWLRERIS